MDGEDFAIAQGKSHFGSITRTQSTIDTGQAQQKESEGIRQIKRTAKREVTRIQMIYIERFGDGR